MDSILTPAIRKGGRKGCFGGNSGSARKSDRKKGSRHPELTREKTKAQIKIFQEIFLAGREGKLRPQLRILKQDRRHLRGNKNRSAALEGEEGS